MAGTKTYDPREVVIAFKGVPLSGFADGTFINIVPSSDRYTKATGADGETARSRSNDRSAEVTLTLMQTSLSNDVLSAFLLADDINNSGSGPLIVKDLSGLTVFFAEEAWIRTPPDQGFSKEVENRDWVFDTGLAQWFVGGSSA